MNRVLRKIPQLIKDEVTEGWRILHSEVLHNLQFTKYYYNDQIEEEGKVRTWEDEKHILNFGWKT
jgi:hypothetical protein